MKIACLQFDPAIGKVEQNIHKADEILERELGIEDVRDKIDVLVLPEMAFTGYNFTKASIKPYLEPTTRGISTQWAQAASRRLRCYTIVGYPELADGYEPSRKAPKQLHLDPFSELPIEDNESDDEDNDDRIQDFSYNSVVVTSPAGEVVMNYRKTFLYMTDEPWASEGSGFGTLILDFPSKSSSPAGTESKQVKIAIGICMDLNPWRFQAPFRNYEFANHILKSGAQLVFLPMAWQASNNDLDPNHVKRFPKVRDERNIAYWTARLEPLFGDDDPEMAVEEETEDADDEKEENIVTPSETEDEDFVEEEWVKLRKKEDRAWGGEGHKKPENLYFVTCNRNGKEKGTLFAGTSMVMTMEKKDGKRPGILKRRDALGMGEETLLQVEIDL